MLETLQERQNLPPTPLSIHERSAAAALSLYSGMFRFASDADSESSTFKCLMLMFNVSVQTQR